MQIVFAALKFSANLHASLGDFEDVQKEDRRKNEAEMAFRIRFFGPRELNQNYFSGARYSSSLVAERFLVVVDRPWKTRVLPGPFRVNC